MATISLDDPRFKPLTPEEEESLEEEESTPEEQGEEESKEDAPAEENKTPVKKRKF